MIKKLVSTIVVLTMVFQGVDAFALRSRSAKENVAETIRGAMHENTAAQDGASNKTLPDGREIKVEALVNYEDEAFRKDLSEIAKLAESVDSPSLTEVVFNTFWRTIFFPLYLMLYLMPKGYWRIVKDGRSADITFGFYESIFFSNKVKTFCSKIEEFRSRYNTRYSEKFDIVAWPTMLSLLTGRVHSGFSVYISPRITGKTEFYYKGEKYKMEIYSTHSSLFRADPRNKQIVIDRKRDELYHIFSIADSHGKRVNIEKVLSDASNPVSGLLSSIVFSEEISIDDIEKRFPGIKIVEVKDKQASPYAAKTSGLQKSIDEAKIFTNLEIAFNFVKSLRDEEYKKILLNMKINENDSKDLIFSGALFELIGPILPLIAVRTKGRVAIILSKEKSSQEAQEKVINKINENLVAGKKVIILRPEIPYLPKSFSYANIRYLRLAKDDYSWLDETYLDTVEITEYKIEAIHRINFYLSKEIERFRENLELLKES